MFSCKHYSTNPSFLDTNENNVDNNNYNNLIHFKLLKIKIKCIYEYIYLFRI